MPGVKYHHPVIGQHKESGVIVVIGLKPGADEHFYLSFYKIILHGFDIAVHVNVAHVGFVDVLPGIFMPDGPRIDRASTRRLRAIFRIPSRAGPTANRAIKPEAIKGQKGFFSFMLALSIELKAL